MKLYELKGIKSYQYATGDQLMMRLKANGVFTKALGKGSYAIAIELSNGEVLKVWAKDEAYEKYIEYCIKNKSNKYLLKTYGKIQEFVMKNSHTDNTENMKFIRIEKLEIPQSLKPFGYTMSDKDECEDFLYRFGNYTTHSAPIGDDTYNRFRLDSEKGSTKFLEFVNAAYKIAHDLRKLKLDIDFSLANFGFRGDQVVFMDPVSDLNSRLIKTIIKA